MCVYNVSLMFVVFKVRKKRLRFYAFSDVAEYYRNCYQKIRTR